MKTTMSMKRHAGLRCVLLSVCLLILAIPSALAEIDLPADTIQVEASAFLNDVSATGLLKVPDTCKFIGDRAFSGTRIYGAELPASITEIGESVFSDNPSLVWVRIASSQLQAAEGALEDVPVVIGPKDSAWAQTLPAGTYFCPSESLVEEEGFYYQILDDSHAVLLCPVDPSKVAADLFTLETIGDVPLTGTTKYAFYGCTQLKTISVRSYYTDLHEEALLPCPQAKLIYEARYLHRVEDTSLSLEGDTKAELENACLAAVGVFSKNGPATFTTNGLVSSQVTSDAYDHSGATGIEVYAEGPESSVSVTVGGGIRAVSRSTDCEKVGNVDTAGISVDVADGGKADISVSGGIFADSVFDEEDGYGWTAGLHHGNSGGNVNIQINGDVTAKSHIYGVGLNVSMLEAAQAYSLIHVKGNVMGESLGIRAQMDDPDGKMEIIVDGTLSGSASPVGLELSMTKNLLLTVWKVVPNGSDDLVVDSEADFTTLKEEEKAIQYILRVAPGQENLLSIEGAKTYKDYLVALEGDTVTLRLNLPEGTESAGVYMDEAQTEQVSADETGAYTFTVPRAGGVVLSVKTK